MSTICINKNAAIANGITVDEYFYLLILNYNIDLDKAHNDLVSKGFITGNRGNPGSTVKWLITEKGGDALLSTVLDADKQQEPVERLASLASSLKAIFPKGKKPGTNYYWAEGNTLIVKRLKLFFKKYGNEFTDNQIITATKKYVESFNGNYTYMKLLKYFLLKDKVGAAGDVESESDLLNYIENAGQEDALSDDWQNTLI